MNSASIEVVRLLLEAIPVVFQEPQFAMKGGTVLNLFIQDLPRLSVDIDVVFIDHTPKASSEKQRKPLADQDPMPIWVPASSGDGGGNGRFLRH